MSPAQAQVIGLLRDKGVATPLAIAVELGQRVGPVQHTLDALYRRSLVTITPSGRWCLTERGRKKVGA